MRTKIVIIMAVMVAVASPGSAQGWRLPNQSANEIRQDINQLESQISRARTRGTISQREATSLRRDTQSVQQLYRSFSRNGLSRDEVARLERSINAIRAQLRLSRRDWDGRR